MEHVGIPKGKNEAILAFCIQCYADVIDNEKFMFDAKKLMKGEDNVSDIFNRIPIDKQRKFWECCKIAREKELMRESFKDLENDTLQADISLELFDLNLLETYLNQAIFT